VTHDDLTVIRAHVPDYAGVDDPSARRASDQHLRAWAGESLAKLRETVPAGAVRERLDAAILRCEFGDQRVIMAFEQHGVFSRPEGLAGYLAADRSIVEAVDALCAARDPDALARGVDALEAAMNGRLAAATGGSD